MTTIDGNVRLTRHITDLDDDGHDIRGATPVVMAAECNAPPAGAGDFDWDTFYDVGGVDLSGVIPPAMGLSYAATVFTADEDGVWLINLEVDRAAAPGEDGELHLYSPTYTSNPQLIVASAQTADRWNATLILPMQTGQSFGLTQAMPTVAAAVYAAMDIVRIARTVS